MMAVLRREGRRRGLLLLLLVLLVLLAHDVVALRPSPALGIAQAPRIVSPLVDDGYLSSASANLPSSKPLFLYLPGFDGTIVSPFLQFPELSTLFDVRGLVVPMPDRSTFSELRARVLAFLSEEEPGRDVYLAGESFGGLLALSLAGELEAGARLKGLVLVNPATSYQRSALRERAPGIALGSKGPLYALNLASLLPLFFDDGRQVSSFLEIVTNKALPAVIDTPRREAFMGRCAFALPKKLGFMEQETLRWRLEEWLEKGSVRVEEEMGKEGGGIGGCPVLVLVGDRDAVLPSVEEAARLKKVIEGKSAPAASGTVTVRVVRGAGHASTLGSRVDLAAEMRTAFGLEGRKEMRREARDGMVDRSDLPGDMMDPISPFMYWDDSLCG